MLRCGPFSSAGDLVKAASVGGEIVDARGQVEDDGGDEPGQEGGVGRPGCDRLLLLLLQRALQLRDRLSH